MLLYTVPVGQGPAIVKGCVLRVNPGALVLVTRDAVPGVVIAGYDNTGGASLIVATTRLNSVFEPGEEIWGWQVAGAGSTVDLGGYQFSTP